MELSCLTLLNMIHMWQILEQCAWIDMYITFIYFVFMYGKNVLNLRVARVLI